MKIKLSKKQWELIGEKTRWIKKATGEKIRQDIAESEGLTTTIKMLEQEAKQLQKLIDDIYIFHDVHLLHKHEGPYAYFTWPNKSNIAASATLWPKYSDDDDNVYVFKFNAKGYGSQAVVLYGNIESIANQFNFLYLNTISQ
jgi:hypothetical protein